MKKKKELPWDDETLHYLWRFPDGSAPCGKTGMRRVTPIKAKVTCLGCQLWIARSRDPDIVNGP